MESGKLSKRTITACICIFLLIPVVVYLGVTMFDDRAYYIISLIIAALSMVPFFLVFEGRKPRSRELVIIAVMIAVTVVGRMAFFMVPQFKPTTAIVIISGFCLGPETGFIIGSTSAFISNLFFGQGPWTPWQMFTFGLIGFLAGVLHRFNLLERNRIQLCIFGGLSALLIYGIFLDLASVFMMTSSNVTADTILATFVSGFPLNVIHAAATVIFMFLLGIPMIKKLERIKIKFGLMEM
ncbi:MAG: ECF transporter S component [Lachnospiraceae bacterium]|nr:ECF transporter S component [Lachnospiraceae bacterium]